MQAVGETEVTASLMARTAAANGDANSGVSSDIAPGADKVRRGQASAAPADAAAGRKELPLWPEWWMTAPRALQEGSRDELLVVVNRGTLQVRRLHRGAAPAAMPPTTAQVPLSLLLDPV